MGTKPQPAPADKPCPWIARQPILALDESVLGYELLFRESGEERFFLPNQPGATDTDQATLAAIDTLNMMGLEVLCDGKAAFINCNLSSLRKGYFSLLPPADTVVEIDDAVPSDAIVEDVCQRLKQAGYRIALDHFVPGDARTPLVDYADFLKVDIKKLNQEESAALTRHAASHRHMVALKVESRQDFVSAKQAGYTMFQGYFFRRPERLQAGRFPQTNSLSCGCCRPSLNLNSTLTKSRT